jgi:hypothetical protein
MANAFVNFLEQAVNGSGNLKDFQHASRLYVTNSYELTPKAAWIYYVVLNINPVLLQFNNSLYPAALRRSLETWYKRYKGNIGLLAKSVDLPKFTIDTETLNQYNRKTIIQKKINYSPISLVFHDDMANVTIDLWKSYYQYYFADSVDSGKLTVAPTIVPKYTDSKYSEHNQQTSYSYGLDNNNQGVPFFTSIDVYQLHKKKYTSFKIVNPKIKEWAHDQLNQTEGNRLMTSKMTVEYETLIYNTSQSNKITADTPGFNRDHYDNSPSPLSIGGVGTNSLFGPGGIIPGAIEIFGDLNNPGASPMDMLNTVIKGANIGRNVSNMSVAGVTQEGFSILGGVLGGISAAHSPQGAIPGVTQTTAPIGANFFTGKNSSTNNQTQATQSQLGN